MERVLMAAGLSLEKRNKWRVFLGEGRLSMQVMVAARFLEKVGF